MVETNGERWLREHNVPDDLLDKYLRGERDDGMKSVFFIQVLLLFERRKRRRYEVRFFYSSSSVLRYGV